MYLGLNEDFHKDTMLTMFPEYQIKGLSIPESFSWREQRPECVHNVRNQGKCGSCWAFSASEVVSDRFCIASNGKINEVYSPQHLVDCDYSNMGCQGGFLTNPFIFYSIVGAQTDECYGEYTSGQTGSSSRFCFLYNWSCPARRTKLWSIRIMASE